MYLVLKNVIIMKIKNVNFEEKPLITHGFLTLGTPNFSSL